MNAPSTPDEAQRLEALRTYAILDTPAERAYDDIVMLASLICDAPIAMISLIDEDRQWLKAKVGLSVLESPRGDAFCSHAILNPAVLMQVHDASLDPRFADNPLVTGEPKIRFYAGAPLVTASGVALGTVCVIDHVPRTLEAPMVQALEALSRQVVALLELRRTELGLRLLAEEREQRQQQLEAYQKELEDLNKILMAQNTIDALTGLKNRRAFDRILGEELSRTGRTGASLALISIDVDHFKSFNDSFGHVAGDEALQQIALMLQSHARPYDHVARYGGEEFILILPDTGIDASMAVAERLRHAMENFAWQRRAMTVSIGVTSTVAFDAGIVLLDRADRALYAAKREGRNRVMYQGADD